MGAVAYADAVKWSSRRRLMFVTGSSGFLGRHLVGTAASSKWEIIAPPSSQLDVCHAESVLEEVRVWKPSAVVHLAYRRDDPRAIVIASANVAAAAAAVGARLVHVSTDVVFGGRPRPYVESDLPTPVTDYGHWKAGAEAEVTEACPSAVIVRPSLIYGTQQLAQVQLDVRDAATGRSSMAFFADEVRCPVHALDLARAIAVLAERRDVTGPLHVTGPEPIDRVSLARLIARWMGHDPAVLRTSTIAESGLVRPARVVLDVSQAESLGIRCRPVTEVLQA
jgi:dTDP-4-dehydrorhamnose reductase